MKKNIFVLSTICFFCISAIISSVVRASDHADPLFNNDPERSIAGLFVFPKEDNLVIVLNFHPGLPPLSTKTKFHDLDDMTYQVHFDLRTPISFSDEQFNQRFGGKLLRPTVINKDASLIYQLDNELNLVKLETTGLLKNAKITNKFIGYRDDPFIFPKFSGKNVVSLVVEISLSSFPAEQKDFVVWGGAYDDDGDKIDHVGRSNRTMQPRLNFLNELEPKDHLAKITQRHNDPNFIQKIIMKKLAPLFAIRDYDMFPDVMIYSNRFPAAFPNGRQLTDDVAAITCKTGDCLLWELSFGDVHVEDWPRKTTNDKDFLSEFPYLAEPW